MFGAEHNRGAASFLFAEVRAPFFSSESFGIGVSTTRLSQSLYDLHLEAPPVSVANEEVISPLEPTLAKNTPVNLLESALTKKGGEGWLWGWLSTYTPFILATLLLQFLFFIPSGQAQVPKPASASPNTDVHSPGPDSAQPDASLLEA